MLKRKIFEEDYSDIETKNKKIRTVSYAKNNIKPKNFLCDIKIHFDSSYKNIKEKAKDDIIIKYLQKNLLKNFHKKIIQHIYCGLLHSCIHEKDNNNDVLHFYGYNSFNQLLDKDITTTYKKYDNMKNIIDPLNKFNFTNKTKFKKIIIGAYHNIFVFGYKNNNFIFYFLLKISHLTII